MSQEHADYISYAKKDKFKMDFQCITIQILIQVSVPVQTRAGTAASDFSVLRQKTAPGCARESEELLI